MIWHSSEINEVLTELSSDPQKGLANGIADQRLAIYGKNSSDKFVVPNFAKRFFSQLKNKWVYVLTAIAIISFAVSLVYAQKDFYMPLLILVILILNALISACHLYRRDKTFNALKSISHHTTTVLREGAQRQIHSDCLVPGDIILLKPGDYITADARLIETSNFRCSESILTGDNIPVDKNHDVILDDITPVPARVNMVFAGSSVAAGYAKAVVVETGINTEAGKSNLIIEQTEGNALPVQNSIDTAGNIINIIVFIFCVLAFVIGVLKNFRSAEPFASLTLRMLLNSLALSVAAIPETLPAITTIVVTLGIERILQDNILIKKTKAIELLGKTNIICSGKTGILTRNRMELDCIFDGTRTVYFGIDDIPEKTSMALKLAAACSTLNNDSTEYAIEQACIKYNSVSKKDIENVFPRLTVIPFDTQRKSMTSINMINGKPIAIVKGAPEILIKKCVGCDRQELLKISGEMAEKGLRVICVAIRALEEIPANPHPEEIENDLTFVGLLGLDDPPRTEAVEGIKACQNAGIRTVMITGDNLMTASAAAKRIGILRDGDLAITGEELEKLSDSDLAENIEKYSVFARITPADKLRIISAWQKNGKVVTVTGDDTEDAAALAAADVGCVMGNINTDVAKGNADIITEDNNFISIVKAIKESRGLFDNIKKAVLYLFSCNLSEILIYILGLIIFGIPPITAVGLLWINLLTDSSPSISLAVERAEPDIMSRKPITLGGKIFDMRTLISILSQALFLTAAALVAFSIGYRAGSAVAMTMVFATVSMSQIFHSYNIKTGGTVLKTDFKSNKFMTMSTILVLFISMFLVLTPAGYLFGLTILPAGKFFICLGLSISVIPFCEILKAVMKKSLKNI